MSSRHLLRSEDLTLDAVRLRVHSAGDGRTAVILLHGFPGHWTSWKEQVAPLADGGYTVVIPELRGYGASDRPREVEAYTLAELVGDVHQLARVFGTRGPPVVVGHDWGGVIAWRLAIQYPEVIERLVIVNAPHPRLFLREVRRPRQALRSWYILLFQLRGLAERVLSAADFRAIRGVFRATGPGGGEGADVERAIADLRQPGALTAALNYYRANRRPGRVPTARGERVHVPTLVLWGERDPALGVGLLDGLSDYVRELRIRRFPAAGHWPQTEAPDALNRELLDFLGAPAP